MPLGDAAFERLALALRAQERRIDESETANLDGGQGGYQCRRHASHRIRDVDSALFACLRRPIGSATSLVPQQFFRLLVAMEIEGVSVDQPYSK